MFKKMKKLSAIFLAVLLGLSTMTTVFAEGEFKEIPEDKLLTEEVIESGKNAITKQPSDVKVKAGATATFSVSAQGMVRSYQWQVSKDEGKTWKKLNAKTDTLSIEAKAEYDGWLYRCAVTFKGRTVVYSEPVKLSIAKETPAQSFESEEEGVSVEAPEGAFPEGTTMEAETPALEDVMAVLDISGVKGSVLSALDLTFYNDGEELQPSEAVTVSFQTEAGLDPEKLALYHINAGAEELRTRGLKANELGFTYDALTGVVTFEGTHFSTYSLVWTEDGVEMGATIVWGYRNGTEFVELEEGSTVTLDTTAATVSLANTIEGYYYHDAVYCTAGQTIDEGADIGSVLHKTETGGWAVDVITTAEDESQTVTRTPIANGSTIYAVYYVPGEPNPSGSLMPSVPSPATQKTVTANGDGTYTIQLDVSGATVTQDESHYVNVLVILDATRSMNGAKWTNAKAAMEVLIETLCEGDNAANAGKIDFALVTFGRSATVTQGWTKNNDAFKTTCAGLNLVTTSGTNWEAGMRGGLYGVLNTYPEGETAEKHDPTYVIFLTDGDPNVYYSSGPDTNYTNTGTTNGYSQNNNTSANRSADEAKAIAAKAFLYGIYCGDSGVNPSGESFNRLVNVIEGQGQGGQDTIAANADTIESEFKKIAETALKNMGPSNISVDDGIPGLSSISANVAGEAGGYEYYKSTDGENFTEWPEAPGAVYSSENGVTWDLSEAGVVQAGTTYRIKFTVWPSQEAYDLLADLNNGLQTLPLSDDKMVQLVVDIGNNRYTYTPGATEGAGTWNGTSGSPLTTEQLVDAIEAAEEAGTDVTYSVPTNTHLRTTYSFDGATYTDIPAGVLPSEDMLLDDTTIRVKKIWNNLVDDRGATPVKDENGNILYYYANLIVTKDGEEYLNPVVVRSDKDWLSDDIFISCGVITTTTTNGVTTVSIKEDGHDYKVIEPEDYSYYWNLTSDVYRPMVINGTPTLLTLETDETILEGLSGDYVSNSNGTWYKIKGKYYKAHDSSTDTLTATNDRRSSLDLKKVVSGFAPEGTEFRFDVTMTFPEDVVDKEVWFSVRNGDETIYRVNTNATPETRTVTGYTYNSEDKTYTYTYNGTTYTVPAADDGTGGVTLTGYYYFTLTNGTGSFYLNLEDGWNARFTNIPEGTEFEITETVMDGYVVEGITGIYEFVKTGETHDCTTGEDPEMTVASPKISGTLGLSNGIYYIEYTNAAEFFFVYHSSNKTIERISMSDPRITENGFDITAEVNKGYLYGGYFKAYTKAGMTDAQIFGATYSENNTASGGVYAAEKTTGYWTTDSTGTAYDGSAAVASAWKSANAYTVSGLTMTPAAGTVYYLKEVPDQYFRPALYYVYDDRAEDKPIVKLFLMVPTDDSMYKQVATNVAGLAVSKRLYSSYTVTDGAGNETTYTATSVNSSLSRGFLTVWDVTSLIEAGKTYDMTPSFITKDGVEVTAVVKRSIVMGNACYDEETSKMYTSAPSGVEAFYVLDTKVGSTVK